MIWRAQSFVLAFSGACLMRVPCAIAQPPTELLDAQFESIAQARTLGEAKAAIQAEAVGLVVESAQWGQASRFYSLAADLFDSSGDTLQARANWMRIVEADESAEDATQACNVLVHTLNDPDGRRHYAQRGFQVARQSLDPMDADVYVQLVQGLVDSMESRGEVTEAAATIETALQPRPNGATLDGPRAGMLRMECASMLARHGRWQEAYEAYGLAFAADPALVTTDLRSPANRLDRERAGARALVPGAHSVGALGAIVYGPQQPDNPYHAYVAISLRRELEIANDADGTRTLATHVITHAAAWNAAAESPEYTERFGSSPHMWVSVAMSNLVVVPSRKWLDEVQLLALRALLNEYGWPEGVRPQ
jgi:tetratricopeptide (TPR) repeat protein